MTAEEIASKVAADFKSFSPAALKLIGLLGHAEISNEEVVEVLKYDSVLTAKMLRSCNSPAMGFAEPVGSIDQAVLLMGYQQILRLALALAFGDCLGSPLPGYAVENDELWRHSLHVAVAAELLSREGALFFPDVSIAFTAGLLHDIGKLGLNQALDAPAQAGIRYLVAEHAMSRIEAERSVLGTDHAEVGGCLLGIWNFPKAMVEGVAHHHSPIIVPHCELSAVVCVANWIAHVAGSAPGWDAYALKAPLQFAATFDLTASKVDQLVIALREALNQAEGLISQS